MKIRILFLLSFTLLFVISCQKENAYNSAEVPTDSPTDTEILERAQRDAIYYNDDSADDPMPRIVSNSLVDYGCGGSDEISSRDAATPLCCCNLGDIRQTRLGGVGGTYYVGIEVGDPRDFEATHWYLKSKVTDDQTGQVIWDSFKEIFPRRDDCDYYLNYFFGADVPDQSYHPSCPDYYITVEFEVYRAYNFNTNAIYLCNKVVDTIRVTIPYDDWCF